MLKTGGGTSVPSSRCPRADGAAGTQVGRTSCVKRARRGASGSGRGEGAGVQRASFRQVAAFRPAVRSSSPGAPVAVSPRRSRRLPGAGAGATAAPPPSPGREVGAHPAAKEPSPTQRPPSASPRTLGLERTRRKGENQDWIPAGRKSGAEVEPAGARWTPAEAAGTLQKGACRRGRAGERAPTGSPARRSSLWLQVAGGRLVLRRPPALAPGSQWVKVGCGDSRRPWRAGAPVCT